MNEKIKLIMDRSSRLGIKQQMNLDSILEQLVDYIEDVENDKDKAKQRLAEFNKDEKIQELEQEIHELRKNSLCILTQKEKSAAEEFWKEHIDKCSNKTGCSYIVTPTGIGSNVKIKCNKCGEEKDLTDYDSW